MTHVKNLPATKPDAKAISNGKVASSQPKPPVEQTTGQPSANVTAEVRAEATQGKKVEDSTENRLARVYDLYDTAQKLEAYQRSRAELKSFKIGSNSMRSTLVIMDDQGKRFETSNSTAIALLVEKLLGILDEKIVETEAQIVL